MTSTVDLNSDLGEGFGAWRLAAEGLPPWLQGFAARPYTPDGRLVPRTEPGSVPTDPDDVSAHAVRLARGGGVQSISVHGDTPGAVALAQATRNALEQAGY